jgi:hypothetical protein
MKSLSLLLVPCALFAQVKFTPADGKVAVEIGGKPFTEFVYSGAPKPFLYPLSTNSGVMVVRTYPPSKDKGEPVDHPHHRGLWFAHDEVNGNSFWNEPKDKVGKQVVKGTPETKGGRKSGSLKATIDWVTPAGVALVTEQRTFTFHDDPKFRIIDVDVTLIANEKVTFGDTKEGTLALRLAAPLQEKGGSGVMVNAEGKTGMKDVWGQPSPWVDYSGTIGDKKVGVAIFDHPKNPGYPNRWHARDYGLFSLNLFGLSDFVRDKERHGGRSLDPGGNLHYKFRVVIHDGDTQQAGIPALYQKFTSEK